MSTKLIPLRSIPYSARETERRARRSFASPAAALDAATYEIVMAPGTHSRPYFDPPTVGWCCTGRAAEALSEKLTHMPGGTSHHRLSFVRR
jgi:hypothetical protein